MLRSLLERGIAAQLRRKHPKIDCETSIQRSLEVMFLWRFAAYHICQIAVEKKVYLEAWIIAIVQRRYTYQTLIGSLSRHRTNERNKEGRLHALEDWLDGLWMVVLVEVAWEMSMMIRRGKVWFGRKRRWTPPGPMIAEQTSLSYTSLHG